MANYIRNQDPRLALATLLASFVAACGGGGGASPPPAPPSLPPVNAEELPIDGDNAQIIAGSVLGSIVAPIELLELANILGVQPLTDPTDSPVLITGPINLPPGPGILVNDDLACVAGRISMVWDDVDNSTTVSTGDIIGSGFVRCEYTDPAVMLDGGMSFSDFEITGDPFARITPWQFAATYNFVDTAAITDAVIIRTDGDLRLDISSDDNLLIGSSVDSTLLTITEGTDIEMLSNFSHTQSFDLNTLVRTITADGTYTNTSLNGSVTFETRDPFIVMGEDNPSAGALFISDNQSSVLITAIDNANAQLEVDFNLDMIVDLTLTVPWNTIGL
ncbi:MAG: hypothetical protein ACR2Q3_13170 [Woeseiaceae bacterium]